MATLKRTKTPSVAAGKTAANPTPPRRGGPAANPDITADIGAKRDVTDAQLLTTIGEELGTFWHDSLDGDAFATLEMDGHLENLRVNSSRMRHLLSHQFYSKFRRVPTPSSVETAVSALQGVAMFSGIQDTPHLRIAGNDTEIHIDLCDEQWQAVVVKATGYRVSSGSLLKFLRRKGMKPLPVPTVADFGALRRFINVSDEDYALVIAWVLACFRPTGPYPVLVLHGEQGSAKSTTAKVLRLLVDPNQSPIRAAPRNLQDLAIAANNSHIIVLDNLSSITPDLSDGLCRLATGGGFATRTLYANDEETIFEAQRPVILTGIEDVASRPDLADRSIVVSLPTIDPVLRRSEKEFWSDFERARPAIFAGILDMVSAAIRNVGSVKLAQLPRMADFVQWSVAAEVEMGLKPGEWMDLYSRNTAATNSGLVDDNPLIEYLQLVLTDTMLVKTTSEWLKAINGVTPTALSRQSSWPKTARKLSGDLRRLAPVLRRVGISIDFDSHSTEHRTKIGIGFSDSSECNEVRGGGMCGIEAERSKSLRQTELFDAKSHIGSGEQQ